MIHLGPILGFRGVAANHWNVSVLLVTMHSESPKLTVNVGAVTGPIVLKTLTAKVKGKMETRKALRFDIAIPITAKEQTIKYEVGGNSFAFVVPADGEPTQLIYASCNGFSSASAASVYQTEPEKNERWRHVLARHQGKDPLAKITAGGGWKSGAFHLLLMGGDQVYGDAIFEVGKIKEWDSAWWEFWKDKEKEPFTPTMAKEAADFYFNQTYVARWSQPSVAAVMARVPTLMMWDDHDIFDGWGSREKELQQCDVYQGIFQVAREHFEIFQRQTVPAHPAPGTLPGMQGLSWGFHLGRLAILAPDMRSGRTQHQVISKQDWNAIYGWLDALVEKHKKGHGPKHLLFLSSIPVIYPSLRGVEGVLAAIPGEQELEDDLRDHWCSRLHYGEQCRLVRRLFDFAKKAHCRVTILSGDVHVAAMGRVTSVLPEHGTGVYVARINQLISSAIVHTPPTLAQAFFIDHVISGSPPSLESGISAEMLDIPGTGSRLVAKRNWLDLALDKETATPRLWANWWFEGEDTAPTTQVIHPPGMDAPTA